jgi:hypothetical protein
MHLGVAKSAPLAEKTTAEWIMELIGIDVTRREVQAEPWLFAGKDRRQPIHAAKRELFEQRKDSDEKHGATEKNGKVPLGKPLTKSEMHRDTSEPIGAVT